MNYYSVLWLKNAVQPLIPSHIDLCDVTLTVFNSKYQETWGIADCQVSPDFVAELDHYYKNGTYKEHKAEFDLLVMSFCVLFKENGQLCKIDLVASVVVDIESAEDEVKKHICRQVDALCSSFTPKAVFMN